MTKMLKKTLVIGSSESGKTYCYTNKILSNPDNTTSYVVLDINNNLYNSNKEILERKGYNIKVLDLCDVYNSIKYNPFNRIKNDADIEQLINVFYNSVFLKDTTDNIFIKYEKYFVSLLFYLAFDMYKKDKECYIFEEIYRFCNMALNDSESFNYIVDKMISDNKNINIITSHFLNYKKCSTSTLQEIIITTLIKLDDILFGGKINKITSNNDINFDDIHNYKTTVFINLPMNNITYDFLASMFISQLYDYLNITLGSNKLNYTVRFVLDDFIRLGKIPYLKEKLATWTNKNAKLKADIVIQSLEQLYKIYEEDYLVIVCNCDSIINFGTISYFDIKELNKIMNYDNNSLNANECLVRKLDIDKRKYVTELVEKQY